MMLVILINCPNHHVDDECPNGAPPSLTSTFAACRSTGSSPMLSYTPPSVSDRFRTHSSRSGPAAHFPPVNCPASSPIGIGRNTGGKQLDAATACATG